MVRWHVKAWHDKRRADSPVPTKGDSLAFFPQLQDVGIGCHCPFDDKAMRWQHERLVSLLSHPYRGEQ